MGVSGCGYVCGYVCDYVCSISVRKGGHLFHLAPTLMKHSSRQGLGGRPFLPWPLHRGVDPALPQTQLFRGGRLGSWPFPGPSSFSLLYSHLITMLLQAHKC